MPIIFVTGFADSEALEEVVGGNIPVLRKPFQIDELERMLLAVLQDRTPAA
jgi:FixJ family two-component response regulator